VASTGLFLFADKLVVVLSEEVPMFEGKAYSKVASLQDLVLKIISTSIGHFVGHLKVINAVSESLEDQINTSMHNRYLLNLFSLEKSLVYYLNAISSNARLIERLKNNATKIGFTPEHTELIDDLLIENSHDLLKHPRQYDGCPRVHRQQQLELADENADHYHHRDSAADAGGQHFFDERKFPRQRLAVDVLGDRGYRDPVRRVSADRLVVEEVVICRPERQRPRKTNRVTLTSGGWLERMAMFDKTATRQVVVQRAAGLHARPSLAVAETVRRFRSQVSIRSGQDQADAGSVLQLLSLGAGQGRKLELNAKGPDAEQVLDELVRLFASDFGLDE
jgi:phosphotransferase system HPr (HPr) family protein